MVAHRVTLDQFQRKLVQLVPELKVAVVRGLKSGALRLDGIVLEEIDHAQPYPAVDRGDLRNSRQVTMHDDGADVAVTAPHAAAIEYGTRPHRPPFKPILDWVVRKGIGVLQGPVPRGGQTRGGGGRFASTGRRQFLEARKNSAYATARAIQAKIARVGTEPRHFFAKAFRRALPLIFVEIDRELAKLARKG